MTNDLIVQLVISTSALSLFGSGYIVVIYFMLRNKDVELEKTFRRAVFLALSDALSSVFWVLNYADASCVAIGGLKLYAFYVNAMWSTMISLSILHAMTNHRWLRWLETNDVIVHLLCWIFPIVPMTIAFSVGAVGSTEYWCWIQPSHAILRAFLYDIPIGFSVIIGVIIYAFAAVKLSALRKTLNMISGGDKKRSQVMHFHMVINTFLLSHLFSWFAILLCDIGDVWFPSTDVLSVFYAIAAGIAPLPGLLNAIIFGADKGNSESNRGSNTPPERRVQKSPSQEPAVLDITV